MKDYDEITVKEMIEHELGKSCDHIEYYEFDKSTLESKLKDCYVDEYSFWSKDVVYTIFLNEYHKYGYEIRGANRNPLEDAYFVNKDDS